MLGVVGDLGVRFHHVRDARSLGSGVLAFHARSIPIHAPAGGTLSLLP